MTEREMPNDLAFPFGGKTNESDSPFAPSAVGEPETPPVFLTRRALRAAGAYDLPSGAEAVPDHATAGATVDATQAMPIAQIAAELAAPVAPLVIAQAPATVFPVRQPDPAAAAVAAAAAAPPHRMRPRTTRPGARPRTARSASQRKTLRQRLSVAGVMLLVGGLFAVLALPAYADNDASALSASATVRTQKLAVSASAATGSVSSVARDSYTATSAADMRAIYAAAIREQNLAAYLQSGAMAKGDDYPWFADPSRSQGGGLSPLGYYYRECVDFVAWRLNRDAGSTQAPFKWTWSKLTPNGGDGHQWKAAWLAHGWPTGTTPKPGSVAWFGDNHVAYVNAILDNGQVLVEEYNYTPHAYDTRVINASDAYYLYAPPA